MNHFSFAHQSSTKKNKRKQQMLKSDSGFLRKRVKVIHIFSSWCGKTLMLWQRPVCTCHESRLTYVAVSSQQIYSEKSWKVSNNCRWGENKLFSFTKLIHAQGFITNWVWLRFSFPSETCNLPMVAIFRFNCISKDWRGVLKFFETRQ